MRGDDINVTITLVISGTDVACTCQLNGSNYQWYHNGNIIAGATDYMYSANDTGEYSLSFDYSACLYGLVNTDPIGVHYKICTGVDQLLDGSNFLITPNPASDIINVHRTNKTSAPADFCLYSSVGSLLQQMNLPAGKEFTEVNISTLKQGLYFVLIESNGQHFSRTFSKQ
ncbi:MAG: T9SS type A sorting domain-containing protein [Chitinophagales bacterium]|nr:T9SS type A sorting domain-containing protein [Chitinophagales bacterium]